MHNFGLEASTKEKLMFVLALPGEKKYKNLRINCIYRLLITLFIPSTLSPMTICQRLDSIVVFVQDAACFLHTHSLLSFSLHVLYWSRFGRLRYIHDLLLKVIEGTNSSITFYGGDEINSTLENLGQHYRRSQKQSCKRIQKWSCGLGCKQSHRQSFLWCWK